MPLPDIHDLLVADAVAPRLDRQRARLVAEVERAQQALRALDRLIGSDELIPYDVTEREEPVLTLSGLHGRCDASELDAAAAALIGELPDGPVTGLCPLDREGEMGFVQVIPVTSAEIAAQYFSPGR